MGRGGTSTNAAYAKGRVSRAVLPAGINSSRSQQKGSITFVRKSAFGERALGATRCSIRLQTETPIALKPANGGLRVARTAASSLCRARMQRSGSAALAATTNPLVQLERCATQAAATRSSKYPPAPRAPRGITAPAAISGCWSIDGSCSKSWAGRLAQRKTSTTSTANAMTTDPKTWSSGNARSPQVLELLITTARAANASRCRRANP
jgi:hypothetical protein